MNLSIHLPDPLIEKLDAYAVINEKSRSSVVREAVSKYLFSRAVATWPADLALWMSGSGDDGASAETWTYGYDASGNQTSAQHPSKD